jgi:hypothetical protein
MSGQQRLSATAARARRHLRLIRGRPLVEQLAVAAVLELEALRRSIERDPGNVRRVLLTIEVADGLVGSVRLAIERARILAPTGTAG